MSGAEASRPFIDAAHPAHPSLLDPEHRMDALFGVVNIPNVVWIDEAGTIVRPPEPGWPDGLPKLPGALLESLPKTGRAPRAPRPEQALTPQQVVAGGQDRGAYADAVRDWVAHGASSRYALSPAEVIARSQPRPMARSEAAAHFELAHHFWRTGARQAAIDHFNACHRLDPGNWTYKRQAWSAVGHERAGGQFGRFVQAPLQGEEADWPFDSDFRSDVGMLGEGEYYPSTL